MPANGHNSPIFIVGYIHTGTSLLKTMLKRSPDVWAITDESHFFQDLQITKREFPDLQDDETRRAYILYLIKLAYIGHRRAARQREAWALSDLGITEAQFEAIVDKTAGIREHELLFAAVVDHLAAYAGKAFWIEKTPEHVYYLNQLFRHLPDAKVVELVRDPRATLASRKVRQSNDEWLDTKERKEGVEVDRSTNYDPLLDSMMWKEAINAAQEARQSRPGNILTMKYEDMVGDPVRSMQKICQFTGITYSDELLEVGWVNAASVTKEGGSPAHDRKAGVSTAAVEKWRKILNEDEIFLCQSLLKKEMRALGYEPVDVAISARMKSPLLFGGTAIHLAQRLGRRRRSNTRAKDAFTRVQRRLFKNLGGQGNSR